MKGNWFCYVYGSLYVVNAINKAEVSTEKRSRRKRERGGRSEPNKTGRSKWMILFDAVQIERDKIKRKRITCKSERKKIRERWNQREGAESGSVNAVKFFCGQRQFFEYFPLNLTSIFTSHFGLFPPFLILSCSILLTPFSYTTSVQSVGNNHEIRQIFHVELFFGQFYYGTNRNLMERLLDKKEMKSIERTSYIAEHQAISSIKLFRFHLQNCYQMQSIEFNLNQKRWCKKLKCRINGGSFLLA